MHCALSPLTLPLLPLLPFQRMAMNSAASSRAPARSGRGSAGLVYHEPQSRQWDLDELLRSTAGER
jgi:hypothetical protein